MSDVTTKEVDIVIPTSKEQMFFEVVGKLDREHEFLGITRGWSEVNTMTEVFNAFGYECDMDGDAISVCYRNWDRMREADEELFWKTLAPVIGDGYIEFENDESYMWRYVFEHGKMKTQEAIIVFDRALHLDYWIEENHFKNTDVATLDKWATYFTKLVNKKKGNKKDVKKN